MNKRVVKWSLVCLMLLAFGLRVIHIDRFSFWSDEALTSLRASYRVADILRGIITIQGFDSQDTHPPFYFLVMHVARSLFGASDFGLRFPSAIFSLLLLPVLYRFGKALFGRKTALITVLIVAINPQQIWYAQEARMYALVVLLVALSGYCLWRGWQSPNRRFLPWLIAFVCLATLSVYTHYVAIFPIAALGVLWLWVIWQNGYRRLIAALLVVALLVALPIAPEVLGRLLSGPEADFHLVPPSVFFLDVVRGFGFGRTIDYSPLPVRLMLYGLILLLINGIYSSAARQRLLLLLYLFAAVVGLLAGSYLFKPMYLGPHHIMVGSPAFLLLIANSIVQAEQRFTRYGGIFALLIVMSAQLTSLNNFYTNGKYAKDDFRSLIRYAEANAGRGDRFLYNNAVLLPLHQHYAERDDLPYTANPVYPYDVDQPDNEDMRATLSGAGRIWFMPERPPLDRDDDGLVEAYLEENATRLQQTSFHGRNTDVKIVPYSFAVPAIHEMGITNELITQVVIEPFHNDVFWVHVLWADTATLPDEVPVALRDRMGRSWVDGLAVVDRYRNYSTFGLKLPEGTPPATYELWIAPGEWMKLVNLQTTSVASSNNYLNEKGIEFSNGLELLMVEFVADGTFPANALPGRVLWRIKDIEAAQHSTYSLIGRREQNEIALVDGSVLADWVDGSALKPGDVLAQPLNLFPQAEDNSGDYRLFWHLEENEQALSAWLFGWLPLGTSAEMGSFTIKEFPLETTLPDDPALIRLPVNDIGGHVSLAGYTLSAEEAVAGETVDLTLYWQTVTAPTQNWNVFVHLVDSAENPPLAQANGVPLGGMRPTKTWRPEEIISDTYQLTLPGDLPVGEYQIFAGLFDTLSGVRAPLLQNEEAQPFEQLLIATITVR